MIDRQLIDRINELARKQRTVGLTPAEKDEQYRLRQQYLAAIRKQVKASLDAMGLKPKKTAEHTCGCQCHRCRPEGTPPGYLQ